ncbi:MAG: hypothetical protein JXR59_07835 [Desulfuromonadaceae bacterium]|nr:hypothetical protein [Desulfuromonadaceae bacterium]
MLKSLTSQKNFWTFLGDDSEECFFGSLETSLQCQGKRISQDPLSYVLHTQAGKRSYFIKVYHRNGKGIRHYFGRGRAEGEWQNLLFFQRLGIPTPRLVAYGQGYQHGRLSHAILITEEVSPAQDLATLARETPHVLQQRAWRLSVLRQVADYTARLHKDGFVHWDLKWRNILIRQQDTEPKVLFFDCPLGKHPFGWLRRRGAIKDLACLDKIGRKVLRRTDRLRFYLAYRETTHLTAVDKKQITQIVQFFTPQS